MTSISYVNLEERWVEGAARCERIAFPTANPGDLLSADNFRAYLEVFPDGVFVAVADDDTVVGVGAGIFVDFDFDRIEHTIWEVTGEHQCANHDPDGAWYYGTDMIVLPEYRRRGIGRRLYELRKELVRRHNKKGIVAGGELPGFAQWKRELSATDYVEKVVTGELRDETLSFQLHNGFEVSGVIDHYIEDPAIDNKAALIVWKNPDERA
jgi:GNAT superfamily N-acetyltransferase